MLRSDVPPKFGIPFADQAGPSFKNPIPKASQIGIANGRASLTDGFPPLNFLPREAGGVPPFGADANGLLNQSTSWLRWLAAGGPILWDAQHCIDIGGYPLGAVISSDFNGRLFLNLVENNFVNPNLALNGWAYMPGMASAGDLCVRLDANPKLGWVFGNGQTIGTTGSGANYVSPATGDLYQYFWENFSQTQCPVTGGRGASWLADFIALKPIGVFNMLGKSLVCSASMGGRSSNDLNLAPVVSGSINTPGSVIGENYPVLTQAQIPAHNHGINDPSHRHYIPGRLWGQGTVIGGVFPTQNGPNNPLSVDDVDTSYSYTGIGTYNTGGSGGHNNVPVCVTGYFFWRL